MRKISQIDDIWAGYRNMLLNHSKELIILVIGTGIRDEITEIYNISTESAVEDCLDESEDVPYYAPKIVLKSITHEGDKISVLVSDKIKPNEFYFLPKIKKNERI